MMTKVVKSKILLSFLLVVLAIGLIGLTFGDLPLVSSQSGGEELVDLRDRTSKTHYLGDGKYALDVSIGSVHYQDESGDWQDIDTSIVSSDRLHWDWEVTEGNWQLLIKDDTTVAVGKGGNWLGFRYTAFGYLDWETKDYHILQTRQNVTPVVDGNTITWPGIFYGSDLEYVYTPDSFKENLYISQETRNYLQLNPPSDFGLSNDSSYLVGVIECDWQLSTFTPEDAEGNPINWDNVQEFISSGINWRDPILDKIITALPLGVAYHEDRGLEDYVDLRYRFYKDGDTHYLLFGAKVLDLNALPVGTIVLDPTIDEQVDANLDDVHERESTSEVVDHASTVSHYSYVTSTLCYWGAHRWVNGSISQGDTIDVAYVEVYAHSDSLDNINGNWHFEYAASPAQFQEMDNNVSSRTRTTASVSDIEDNCGIGWHQTDSLVTPLQEVVDDFNPTAFVAIFRFNTDANKYFQSTPHNADSALAAKLHIEYTSGGASAPTVVTSAATLVEDTTARLNGEVTDTGGENPTVTVYWGDEDGLEVPGNWDYNSVPTSPAQPQGAATFYKDVTSLPTGTTIFFNARAVNTAGTDWGTTRSFLTKPAAPTNVAATDGVHTDKVVITWTKSTGATGYKVYRDGGLIDTIGDVATYDDTGADAPTITPGSAVASDGSSTAHVALSLSGTSTSVGTTHVYKLKAINGSGDSDDSDTDNGYRGVGSLTYQWQRSAADSDADYSNIVGATASTYNDDAAPAPTITAGSSVATDGVHTDKVALSLSGTSTSEGAGRHYQCVLNAAGAAEQTSADDRGYRSVGSLTYQWQRSAADSDTGYGDIVGATASTYDDTAAPAPTITPGSSVATDGDHIDKVALSLSGTSTSVGDGRHYRCVLNAAGAAEQTSESDRGYRSVGSLTYQWQRSAADSDADYGNIEGATGATYDDTAAPGPTITPGSTVAGDGSSTAHIPLSLSGSSANNGDGRHYQCVLNAAGAVEQTSASNRGYRGVGSLTYQWQRSSGDADSDYSNITGATSSTYNDSDAPAPSVTAGNATASDGTSSLHVTLTVSNHTANNGAGRYYQCVLDATGASQQTSASNRGHRGTASLAYQWMRSYGDTATNYSNIAGGTANPYNDTGGVIGPDGRYYQCLVEMSDAVSQNSSADRGYKADPSGVAGPPLNFTATAIGTTCANLTWVKGLAANTTWIYMSEEAYPSEVGEGLLVYSGNGTSVNLCGLNLITTTYYFSAWSHNDHGYSLEYAEVNIGGNTMLSIVLITLALGVTAIFLWRRSIVFAMGASLGWVVLGIVLLVTPTSIGLPGLSETWVEVLAYLFFLMAAGCLLWYIGGLGRVSVTKSLKGMSWQSYEKPPKEAKLSRSQAVKDQRRSKIRGVVEAVTSSRRGRRRY